MYTPAHIAREHSEELERLFFGLSMAEQSFAACADVREMCASQLLALTSQRERLGGQRLKLAERAEEAERERRLLYERLAG
jgi:hypothetical protein